MKHDRPLITFAVIAYNNELFVREAVEGAFRQTYEPLQIILSDDSSRDSTFHLMAGMAERYSGPHQIVLNRNEKNRGIGDHINRVMELAKGEWVVIAAGDDISMPERTVEIWQAVRPPTFGAMAAYSDLLIIDENGDIQGEMSSTPDSWLDNPVEVCRRWFGGMLGAASAWNRQVFKAFGPLDPSLTFEDGVITFRATLLGNIQHIPKPLVKYRRDHGTNISEVYHSQRTADLEKWNRYYIPLFNNCLKDLDSYSRSNQADHTIVSVCRSEILRSRAIVKGRLKILSGRPLKMIAGFTQLMMLASNPLNALRLVARVFAQKYKTLLGR